MKKKYADFPGWPSVIEKEYVNKYVNDGEFIGNISMLTAVKVKRKVLSDDNETFILDDGYKWMEFYSDNNKNIAMTVTLNNKNEILQWYFDIAKNTLLTDKGVPYIEDLYLDVIYTTSGKIIMIDEDEIKEALENKDITKEEYDFAYRVAKDLIDKIDGKLEELMRFTYKYVEIFN